MDKVKKPTGGLLETESLASALPEKTPEQRPKYVQILQHEKNVQTPQSTPSKSPVSLGANSSSNADTSISTIQDKSAKKSGFKNNNNKSFVPLNGKRPVKIFLKKQEVVALPADVKTRDMPISPENALYFNGPNHYLSALYPTKVIVDGNEYNSVEHYYQACKLYTLIGTEAAAKLKAFSTPMEVKKATKTIMKEAKVPGKKVADWKETESIGVLKHVTSHKFNQNEELKKKLLETGDKILIQTYIGDTYFAAGAGAKYTSTWVARHVNQRLVFPEEVLSVNVKYLPLVANGKNTLGWILMHVRDELRAQTT